MKKFLLYTCIFTVITLFAYSSSKKFSPLSISYTVKITKVEFDSLALDFQTRYPLSTWGGVISKDSIQKIIDSMPGDSSTIDYIFDDDVQFNKVSVAIRGSANPGNNETPLCFRNGKIAAAFCPDSCNFPTSNVDVTIRVSYTDYVKEFQSYAKTNANSTYGGCFDKESMILIINSINATSDNLNFRFYYNNEFKKIGIIFIGGQDENNETIYYKNGLNQESFCPNDCKN
jgi:hypothetical protein